MGSLLPTKILNLHPQVESKVLTTGPPGKFPLPCFLSELKISRGMEFPGRSFEEYPNSTAHDFDCLTSTAVLYVCSFTANGSQMPSSFMSTKVPVSPFTPQVSQFSWVCLACSWNKHKRLKGKILGTSKLTETIRQEPNTLIDKAGIRENANDSK